MLRLKTREKTIMDVGMEKIAIHKTKVDVFIGHIYERQLG